MLAPFLRIHGTNASKHRDDSPKGEVDRYLTCSLSLVNERAAGTMERFLNTPVKPAQILAGYALGFGVMSFVQAAIILLFGLGVIGFPNEGNIALVVFIAISLAVASVMLGLLVSGLATTAFQVMHLMLLFVVPQILLCGLFDLSASPDWVQALSRCLPLTYGVDAMMQVMLGVAGFAEIWIDFAVIWGLYHCILRNLRASFPQEACEQKTAEAFSGVECTVEFVKSCSGLPRMEDSKASLSYFV